MDTLETLTRRNRDFAAEKFQPGLTLMPRLRAMIVGCADPRVDPADVLGLESGEAAVIRNVGGRVTPNVLQEIKLLQAVAGAEGATPGPRFDLIVLHHTDCGITRLEVQRQMLAKFFGIEEENLTDKSVSDPRGSVITDMEALQAAGLPPGWVVSGLLYDVRTGLLETVSLPGMA